MSDDPAGYYARLEVDPAAPQEAIAAAFRRKARVLHPDVAGTGNADAFMRMKQAYDVLSDVHRRAGYDRGARDAAMPEPIVPPPATQPMARGPRLSDLPVAVWAGLGGAFCMAVAMVTYQAIRQPAPTQMAARPSAPSVAPAVQTAPAPSRGVAPDLAMFTHYVLPAGAPAKLWQRDATRDGYRPVGQTPAFTSVQVLSLVPQHGLVEVRLADGGLGLIDAARLTPGNPVAARRGYCIYNAGATPANGEVLDRRGAGNQHIAIENRSGQPAVVKLRDASGSVAATVFLASDGKATVNDLPDDDYRPDFATGELWSRACQNFTAGMRAQRFAAATPLADLSPLVIPPELSGDEAPVDIPDAVFAGD